MVTWGANTTHTFGTPAPAPPAFGTPAAAAGGIFGSSPAPTPSAGGIFGSHPAPAPSGGMFGSAPAPAPVGGLFGSTPAPAPSGGLFGSTPAPAPSVGFASFGASAPSGGSLFGTPTASSRGSLFGTPAPSGFGSGPAANMQQLPAQAALQAHMDASARQEADRVRMKLDALNSAYAGTPRGDEGSKFVAIVYSPLTPEQRQFRWMQGISTGVIPMPPRPLHVSEKQWMQAVVENPDPDNYVPEPLVGAGQLQTWIAWQQTRANDLAGHANSLHQAHETLQERMRLALHETEAKARRHAALRKRLLDVMRRVELTRCLHQPTQPDELKVLQRLSDLHKQVDQAQRVLLDMQDQARSVAGTRVLVPEVPAAEELLPVLTDHRQKLQKLIGTGQRDQRDVGLIAKRVVATTGSRM